MLSRDERTTCEPQKSHFPHTPLQVCVCDVYKIIAPDNTLPLSPHCSYQRLVVPSDVLSKAG